MIKNTLYLLVSIIFFSACNNQNPQPVNDEEIDEEEQYIPEVIESFDCFPQYDESSFDIVTWNVERYPLDYDTPSVIRTVLDTTEVDIFAFQEIQDPENMTTVIDSLADWEFVYADVRYDLEIGFAYRPEEIVSITDLELLFQDDSDPFPREAVKTTVEHISGREIHLINIHLKCCNDGVERRTVASEMMKNYIETELSGQDVILLGDFNDEIDDAENPFSNFINDSENYLFADMDIALGNPEFWSYPSFGPEGSHIDHILLANGLLEVENETQTLKVDDCVSRYEYNVSDHLPVMTSLSF
ncbi:MAG: endonuclease/exonuclease/phosphatase family protein [Bacteroidota bacterium]